MLPNILNMAMSVLGKQKFTYLRYRERTVNAEGIYLSDFANGVGTSGQVQAVPREMFIKYGLDFQKTYLMVFVSKDVLDLERGVAGDMIKYANDTYQVVSETDWFDINGWTSVLCVKVAGE